MDQQYESQQHGPHLEKSQQNEAQHNDSQRGTGPEETSQHQPQAMPIPNTLPGKETLPEECTICLCVYKEQERRPRTLPCGHTLCSLCIAALLKEGYLSCPSCLTHHHATSASHFPVNYALENMIMRFRILQAKGAPLATTGKIKQNGGAGLGRKLQSVIKEQKESMESLGVALKQELNQLEQYRAKLSLSLANHGRLLEELDRVGQQHREAMKLLMEEDLRVEAFMEEGEKDHRDLKAAQDQLDCVTSAQKAYPFVDAADNCALVVEEWIQSSKEEFPNGTAYSTSCTVLENTEAVLREVVLEGEDTTESITSGHPSCTILDVLKNIHERSVELVKLHIKKKLRNAVEDDPVSLVKKDENECFSFPKMTSEGNKTSLPTFTFKFTASDSSAVFPPPKFEAALPVSSSFQGSRSQAVNSRLRKIHRPSMRKEITQPAFTPTTTTLTTTTTTTTTNTTCSSSSSCSSS